jgi:hypothetical protein
LSKHRSLPELTLAELNAPNLTADRLGQLIHKLNLRERISLFKPSVILESLVSKILALYQKDGTPYGSATFCPTKQVTGWDCVTFHGLLGSANHRYDFVSKKGPESGEGNTLMNRGLFYSEQTYWNQPHSCHRYPVKRVSLNEMQNVCKHQLSSVRPLLLCHFDLQ